MDPELLSILGGFGGLGGALLGMGARRPQRTTAAAFLPDEARAGLETSRMIFERLRDIGLAGGFPGEEEFRGSLADFAREIERLIGGQAFTQQGAIARDRELSRLGSAAVGARARIAQDLAEKRELALRLPLLQTQLAARQSIPERIAQTLSQSAGLGLQTAGIGAQLAQPVSLPRSMTGAQAFAPVLATLGTTAFGMGLQGAMQQRQLAELARLLQE